MSTTENKNALEDVKTADKQNMEKQPVENAPVVSEKTVTEENKESGKYDKLTYAAYTDINITLRSSRSYSCSHSSSR